MPVQPQLSTARASAGNHGHGASGLVGRVMAAINLPFVIVATLLVLYGLMVVYSAVSADEDYTFSRQLGGVAIGLVVMALVWAFDYRRLSEYTTLFIIVNVVLILSPHLPVIGVNTMGATSWVKIGPLPQLQPGEFAKITVILLDASIMAKYQGRLGNLVEYLKAAGFTVDMQVVDWATLTQRRQDPAVWDIFITHSPFLPEPALIDFPSKDALLATYMLSDWNRCIMKYTASSRTHSTGSSTMPVGSPWSSSS